MVNISVLYMVNCKKKLKLCITAIVFLDLIFCLQFPIEIKSVVFYSLRMKYILKNKLRS